MDNPVSPISVDAPPASDWSGPRPAGLHPHLWAETRATNATLDGLSLPDGTVVYGSDGQVLGWESSGETRELGELWLRCAQQFPSTGLWPICDGGRLGPSRGWNFLTADCKPYWQDPYAIPSDVYDAVNIADRNDYFDSSQGPDYFRELLRDLDLNDTSMKLAEGSAIPPDPLRRLIAPDAPTELTLVACQRPSDAVLLLDFGVANDDATPGIFAGVLRSWETRFGVVPEVLTSGWTAFQVLAPPTKVAEVERLATEVVSFATDSAIQGGFYVKSRDQRVTAQNMVQSSNWIIWWD
ncbi:DUF4253 domain-containing protein [Prescottella agglutinans]|uniref:DUF4253 domain-containing protein n=1 Tax=Prescottella agglutinans TaxID=1644129 RepID=A0ABT6MJ08_9NOCA|nr:DUF4253 domain-containing protein [Prescottella agglutinans]MDH6284280.1 hypothetical protein [Prescottella agglutinans]